MPPSARRALQPPRPRARASRLDRGRLGRPRRGRQALLARAGEEPVRHRVVERAEVQAVELVDALGLLPGPETQAALQEVAVRAVGEASAPSLADERWPPRRRRTRPPRRRATSTMPSQAVRARLPGRALLRERAATKPSPSSRWRATPARPLATSARSRSMRSRAASGSSGCGRPRAVAPGDGEARELGRGRCGGPGRPRGPAAGRTTGRARGPSPCRSAGRTARGAPRPRARRSTNRRRSVSWASRVVRELRRERLALVVEEQRVGPDHGREGALDEAGDEHEAEAQTARAVDRADEDAVVVERALAVALGGQQLADAGQEVLAGRARGVAAERPEDALEALARRGGRGRSRRRGGRASRPGSRPSAPSGGKLARSWCEAVDQPDRGCRRGAGRGRPRTRAPRGLRAPLASRVRQESRPQTMPACAPRGGPSATG